MPYSLLDPLFLALIDKLKTPEYLVLCQQPRDQVPGWMILNKLQTEIDPNIAPALQEVAVKDIKLFLMSQTDSLLYGKLAFWAIQTSPTVEIPLEKIFRSAMLRDLLSNGIEYLDPSNAELMAQVVATINYFVQSGDLPQSQADELLAKFYTPVTWAEGRNYLAVSLSLEPRDLTSNEVDAAIPFALQP